MTETTNPSTFAAAALRPDELASIDRGSGARTIPLVTADRGATTFLNGVTVFSPGAAIGHHRHNCVESVMVIEGDAVVDIDGEETALRPHDVTFVPGNIPHHFRNASSDKPMRIFWTYASIDATRTLTASDSTARIDAEQASATSGSAVTEIVDLQVVPGKENLFEAAIGTAGPLFQRATGCRSFNLTRTVEEPDRYRLFISWTHINDHLIGFRESTDFGSWRALVTPFLSTPPEAEHVQHVLKAF